MRKEKWIIWIAAVSLAGIACYINLGMMCIRVNPWGLATSILPESIDLTVLGAASSFLCNASLSMAVILMGVGVLDEWLTHTSKCKTATASHELV